MNLDDKIRIIQEELLERGHTLEHGVDGVFGDETADAMIAELGVGEVREDLSYRMSQHFTLGELTKSQWAKRNGVSNLPATAVEFRALKRVCDAILEPVRAHFGKPVHVSSGYRSPRVNAGIGGSSSSQHMKGQAVDFEIPGVANYDVAVWIRDNLNYDQLILEFHTPGQPNSGWIHVGYSGVPHKNEELTAVRRGGKVRYLPGLVK